MARIFRSHNSKLADQAINKYHYYLRGQVLDLFENVSSLHQLAEAKTQSMTIFHRRISAKGQFLFNEESIKESIAKTYLSKINADQQILKIDDNTYSKAIAIRANSSYSVLGQIQQIIELVVKNQKSQSSQRAKSFQIYVIHHCSTQKQCNGSELKWLHFVENYHICRDQIAYCMIATIAGAKRMINWGCKVRIFQKLILSYFLFNQFQGHILELGSNIKQKQILTNDPAFSDEHKISKRIPFEFLKTFYALKKQFGEDKQKDIGRFMLARSYSEQQTRKSLRQYFEWKKAITQKYKWQDFKDFQALGIFHYLGQDYKGRPVVFNQNNALKINQVNLQKYCDFFIYFLEIYIPTKMRGNVYQMTIIGDAGNVTGQNYKLSITKQNILSALKYCAQRQHRLIAVNSDIFTYYLYKIIKPILPKNSQNKIIGLGTNTKQNLNQLLQLMNLDIIPKSIGGGKQLN